VKDIRSNSYDWTLCVLSTLILPHDIGINILTILLVHFFNFPDELSLSHAVMVECVEGGNG